MNTIAHRIGSGVIFVLAVLATPGVSADELPTIYGGLEIGRISAEAGAPGKIVSITFDVESSRREPITIRGIRIVGDVPSRIVGSMGKSRAAVLPSLMLLPGERVSLRTGALWFETGPLKQEWRPDTHLSASLILDRFEIPVEIHIESPMELSGRRTPQDWNRNSSKC